MKLRMKREQYMSQEQSDQNKIEELKQQYLQQQEAMKRELEAEKQMQSLLKKTLSEDALERLNNVKIVNRELYMKAFRAIMQMIQKGYVTRKITEQEVRQILLQLKKLAVQNNAV